MEDTRVQLQHEIISIPSHSAKAISYLRYEGDKRWQEERSIYGCLNIRDENSVYMTTGLLYYNLGDFFFSAFTRYFNA